MPSIKRYQAWIKEGLAKIGKQQVDLAEAINVPESRLSEYLKASKDSKTKFLTADVADRISNFLGEAVPSDFHVHAKPIQVEEVRVVGRIGRRIWEDETQDEPEPTLVSSVKHDIFPADIQVAYEMASPSGELGLMIGDHLICVPFGHSRTSPQPNDIIVYKTNRGNLANYTLLRAVIRAGKIDLETLMDYGSPQEHTVPVALVIASRRTYL